MRPEVTDRVELMPLMSPLAVAREWNRVNVLLEWRKPPHYLRLKYEDFADAPQQTVTRIVDVMRGLGWKRWTRHVVALGGWESGAIRLPGR